MQNRIKQDSIFVDVITPPNDVKNVSKKAVGNASKYPFCVYDHHRHAVGSVIKNRDGLKSICTEDGSWQNF